MENKLRNFSWLLSDNVFGIFIGLVTSVVVVRYLGPENNGILNYCLAYVSLWSAFSDMGAASIIQKEEVIGTVKTNILIGTGLVIGIIGGILTTGGTVFTMLLLKESKGLIICALLIGSSYILKSFYIIKYILLARLQADKFVKANIKVQVAIAVIKVAIVLIKGNIYMFAGCYCIEALLQTFFYYKIYLESIEQKKSEFSYIAFQSILRQSWPNIIASFAVTIYMKSDQIMIGRMLGNESVGIYSVAVTISGVAQFIYMAIASTMLPVLTAAFNENKERFHRIYVDYMEKIILLICLIVIGIVVFSGFIILILYGKGYADAIPVIRIYAISEIFAAIGVIEGAYVNLYRLQKKSMHVTCVAALINVILNLILIPRLGCEGAAIATIAAMFLQSVVLYLFWKETREIVKILGRALLFKNTIGQLGDLYKKNRK